MQSSAQHCQIVSLASMLLLQGPLQLIGNVVRARQTRLQMAAEKRAAG